MITRYVSTRRFSGIALLLTILLSVALYAVEPSSPEHFAIREMLKKNDGEQALKEARMLSKKGDAYGHYVAGLLLMGNFGMQADWPVAVSYMEKAADTGCGDAEGVLGAVLCDGPAEIKDVKKAIIYLERAAAKNLPTGLDMLARLYYDGVGFRKDLKKAREYFIRAADLGYPAAQKRLGIMLFDGEGGKADQKSAVVWLNRAASTGNANALYLLGYMSENGKYFRKDLVEAAKNYILAVEKPEAVAGLERLKNSLSVVQYEEAQRRAKAWQKSEPWKATSSEDKQALSSSASSRQQSAVVPDRQVPSAVSAQSQDASSPDVDVDDISSWPKPEPIMSIQQIENTIISDYCAE